MMYSATHVKYVCWNIFLSCKNCMLSSHIHLSKSGGSLIDGVVSLLLRSSDELALDSSAVDDYARNVYFFSLIWTNH